MNVHGCVQQGRASSRVARVNLAVISVTNEDTDNG